MFLPADKSLIQMTLIIFTHLVCPFLCDAMKRNVNLIELSRDHHHGLLLGWKIKQGLKKQVAAEEIIGYVVYFANEALFPHFKEEEDEILPFLSVDDPFHQRTLAEHIEIREIISRLSIEGADNSFTLLLTLAETLEAHIRFEERELFPHIENTLPEDKLNEIGDVISKVHHNFVDTYPNVFWTN